MAFAPDSTLAYEVTHIPAVAEPAAPPEPRVLRAACGDKDADNDDARTPPSRTALLVRPRDRTHAPLAPHSRGPPPTALAVLAGRTVAHFDVRCAELDELFVRTVAPQPLESLVLRACRGRVDLGALAHCFRGLRVLDLSGTALQHGEAAFVAAHARLEVIRTVARDAAPIVRALLSAPRGAHGALRELHVSHASGDIFDDDGCTVPPLPCPRLVIHVHPSHDVGGVRARNALPCALPQLARGCRGVVRVAGAM